MRTSQLELDRVALVSSNAPLGDEVFPDRRGVCWPNVGVMDPGRDTVYFESGGGHQHHDIGTLPTWLKGLPAVSLDVDPVPGLMLMKSRG